MNLKNGSFIFSVQNYTFFLSGENFSPAYFFLLHSLCKLKYITDSLHTAFILYTFAFNSETTCASFALKTNCKTMKKRLSILAFFCLCLGLSAVTNAQDLRDASYSRIGQIDSDGTVRNASYTRIGQIDNDGTVRNASYTRIGQIDNDGTVRNASYTRIGQVDNDGTVRNASYTRIGQIDNDGTVRNASYTKIGTAKGVRKRWAAAFFFFNFFKKPGGF